MPHGWPHPTTILTLPGVSSAALQLTLGLVAQVFVVPLVMASGHTSKGTLTKVPTLSGLFEYDEKNRTVIPIRLARISVGATHASAVMDNVTYLDASERGTENDTNWGADILFWGGNEFYQLGTGKRNNVSNPVYIRPLDMNAEIEVGRKEEHRFHITPRHTVRMKGRKVSFEQRVECGRGVTAVYSGV